MILKRYNPSAKYTMELISGGIKMAILVNLVWYQKAVLYYDNFIHFST